MAFLTQGPMLLYAGLGLGIVAISFLTLNQRQKDVIFRRLRLRGRRASTANTPPRSVSPDKKEPKNSPPSSSEYVNAFPPLTRDLLEEVAADLPANQRDALGDLSFDEENWHKSIMGFEEDFRTCEPSKYNFSGYSVKEIRALGDFPDYSTLSGVPLPEPYPEHDIQTALPRPYRPFRWAYHQTMCKWTEPSQRHIRLTFFLALTKMETDWWLELENTYVKRIAERKRLYAEHGESVLQCLPGSELACKELMEMIIQFLCARYPQYFYLHEDKKTFENKILGTKQDVSAKHPLLVILDNVPEDFAITLRNPETGYYHFRAGVICSALGWNVGTKIGKSLPQIHAPIPDYKEKMQFSMDRYVGPNTPPPLSPHVGHLFLVEDIDTYLIDSSPRCPHKNQSSVAHGVSKSINLCTCHQVIHMRNTVTSNLQTLIFHAFIYGWTGKLFAACLSLVASCSTSRLCSPRSQSSAMSHISHP